MSKIKIAVDAGHGSKTAGKRTPPMPDNLDFNNDGVIDVKKCELLPEHVANVGVCTFLKAELLRNGFDVYQSAWDDDNGWNDADVELTTRQKNIKAAGCKYSVSVHFNAYGDGKTFNSANGVGTYIHSNPARVGNSKKLAGLIQKRLCECTVQKNRGINAEGFALCNCETLGTKASVLVELAFMTNEKEATEMVANALFWKECAKEICKGFCDMEGKKYVPEGEERIIYRVQVGAYSKLENAKSQLERVKAAGFVDAMIKED